MKTRRDSTECWYSGIEKRRNELCGHEGDVRLGQVRSVGRQRDEIVTVLVGRGNYCSHVYMGSGKPKSVLQGLGAEFCQ